MGATHINGRRAQGHTVLAVLACRGIIADQRRLDFKDRTSPEGVPTWQLTIELKPRDANPSKAQRHRPGRRLAIPEPQAGHRHRTPRFATHARDGNDQPERPPLGATTSDNRNRCRTTAQHDRATDHEAKQHNHKAPRRGGRNRLRRRFELLSHSRSGITEAGIRSRRTHVAWCVANLAWKIIARHQYLDAVGHAIII